MVDEFVNITEVVGAFNQTVIDSISSVITIFQIVGIALIIYIIFLILRAVFNWRTMAKISKMAKNVEEINKKMDVLIEKIDGINKKEEVVKQEKKGFFKRLFGKSEIEKKEDDKIENNDKKIKKIKKEKIS